VCGNHDRGVAQRRRAARRALDRARLAEMTAHIDKAAFTRADMVELIGAQLPVDAPGTPRELIEQIVDAVGVRVSAPRQAHEREGHEKYSLDVVMAEEARIFGLVDEADHRARWDVRSDDINGLAADQVRVVRSIAVSPFLVQPLCAPAGAGKTRSLRALRAGATRGDKQVLVVAPTGKAVDEAMRDGAGDRGLTVSKALQLLDAGQLALGARSVVVVDEASMVELLPGVFVGNDLLRVELSGRPLSSTPREPTSKSNTRRSSSD
jgi:hypothetical protein